MQKKFFYIAFLLILSMIIVGLGCTNSTKEMEDKQEKDLAMKGNEEPKQKEKRLEIVDYLLPMENSKARTEKITHVMIHFVSNAYQKPNDPYVIEDIYTIFKDYGVSSHYVIGRKGEIYRMVAEDRVAFHAGKGSLPDFPEYTNRFNDYSIGIELLAIGTREEMIPIISREGFDLVDPSLIGYTEEQYEALNLLLEDILERNPLIVRDRKHIVGHDEYAPDRKTDPGTLFDWSRIGF